MNDFGSTNTLTPSNWNTRSRCRGCVSKRMLYDNPEHPPPETPSRSPPCEGSTFSFAMATRMRASARPVTSMPLPATVVTSAGLGSGAVGAAHAPGASVFSVVLIAKMTCGFFAGRSLRSGFHLQTPARQLANRLNLVRGRSLLRNVDVLLLPVSDRRADRILCQHRAMNLHRRQRQLADDVGVLDRQRLVHGFALHPLGR